MGFLIARNSRTRAGWFEDFVRPGLENPVQRPWVHLADGSPADINALGELHIPQNSATVTGGGESYAFQPITSSWGFDTEFWWPVGGAAAQSFDFYFTDSWVNRGAAFTNCVGIRFFYRITGDTIYVGEFPAMIQPGSLLGDWPPPVSFNGHTLTLRVWVEDDRWVRVWLNNTYLGSVTLDQTYYFGPNRRCLRMVNASFSDMWMRWLYHYDRPATLPQPGVWNSQIFYDDFNRANGQVDNGWTVFGTAGQIVSNSYATTGTTDGSRGILRSTGVTNGRIRIEATLGGAIAPNNTADSSLILCANTGGTQGLAVNIFGNKLYLSRWSGSLTSPTFTDFGLPTNGVTVSSGDVVAFSLWDGIGWLEVNGQRRLYAATMNDVVPASNPAAGLRVERTSFNNSASFNDVRILTAA
ncbi:hypothetical protein C5E45_32710 [Nocardia nova]|uniref:Uncharacterized protein n=1 Tax=Nocardia nova TaxID=37330 RepID=A0A2S6ACN7_9NOCA|nr:hypothetical protein [Nocardia nova]PPJ31854.1 hypothetical protein C5E45_32710 [Nocardia nova]